MSMHTYCLKSNIDPKQLSPCRTLLIELRTPNGNNLENEVVTFANAMFLTRLVLIAASLSKVEVCASTHTPSPFIRPSRDMGGELG